VPARIAQLSDLHLVASEGARVWGADPWANLRRVLDALAAAAPKPDLVVLTGDVANDGKPQSYARLREWLAPWRDRLAVIPGNHDHRANLRAAFAEHVLPGRPTVHFALVLGGWQLLGLDSLRRFFVHGLLGREQIGWLGRELDGGESPVLLFLHHPPVRVGCWWLDKDRLRDRGALEGVVRGGRVRAIACGHVHQEREDGFAGARVFTCPSTAYQFAQGAARPSVASLAPAYRVFELDGAELRTQVIRLADAGTGARGEPAK
jgi:3',5'-cyclic AMP phosphodiesterase CpdA